MGIKKLTYQDVNDYKFSGAKLGRGYSSQDVENFRTSVSETIESLEKEVSDLRIIKNAELIEEHQQRADEAEQKYQNLVNESQEFTQKIDDLSNDNTQLQENVTNLNTSITQLRQEKAEIENKLAESYDNNENTATLDAEKEKAYLQRIESLEHQLTTESIDNFTDVEKASRLLVIAQDNYTEILEAAEKEYNDKIELAESEVKEIKEQAIQEIEENQKSAVKEYTELHEKVKELQDFERENKERLIEFYQYQLDELHKNSDSTHEINDNTDSHVVTVSDEDKPLYAVETVNNEPLTIEHHEDEEIVDEIVEEPSADETLQDSLEDNNYSQEKNHIDEEMSEVETVDDTESNVDVIYSSDKNNDSESFLDESLQRLQHDYKLENDLNSLDYESSDEEDSIYLDDVFDETDDEAPSDEDNVFTHTGSIDEIEEKGPVKKNRIPSFKLSDENDNFPSFYNN